LTSSLAEGGWKTRSAIERATPLNFEFGRSACSGTDLGIRKAPLSGAPAIHDRDYFLIQMSFTGPGSKGGATRSVVSARSILFQTSPLDLLETIFTSHIEKS
jgi:hypothetical protein